MRRITRTLVAAALMATLVSGTAGWASGNAQQPVTGPPPGTAEWRDDGSLGRALPDPEDASPAQVAYFFSTLSPKQQQSLTKRHPTVVGNLDGAPIQLRYRANKLAIAKDPRYTRLATGDRQILAFDPRGRGTVAEVYGDLLTARHVSVVVPGSDIDAGSYDRSRSPYGTPAGMATSLRTATKGRTAVVAWAGYTTPVGVGLDVASGELAEAGARRLVRFTEGLTAAGSGTPKLFCHSYGSVVCGLAAPKATASDIVVFASPGMRADSVDALGTDATVWAAKDSSDWISKVPNVEFLGLGHGPDPAAEGFGARRVPARTAHGHAGYFAPGTDSLRAFASIATGGDVR